MLTKNIKVYPKPTGNGILYQASIGNNARIIIDALRSHGLQLLCIFIQAEIIVIFLID